MSVEKVVGEDPALSEGQRSMSLNENERATRARNAALTRYRPDDPETIEARREFKASRLAAYIEKVVAEAPELSPRQLDTIAALLRGGCDGRP